MQQGVTGNVSRIVTDTGNYIFNVSNTCYANRQAAQDEQARKFSNYIPVWRTLSIPPAARTFKVASGANHFWVDVGEDVVGTDLHINPDVRWFQEMVGLP